MILVLVFFLSKDNKSWELLKPLWNPASSSHNMVFNDLIIHLSWDLVHIWISWWMISSVVIVYFKKWGLLSQLLSNVFTNIGVISFTLLLILILLNFDLIFKLFFILILIIIVYLCFHFWSFVNWLIHSLDN